MLKCKDILKKSMIYIAENTVGKSLPCFIYEVEVPKKLKAENLEKVDDVEPVK